MLNIHSQATSFKNILLITETISFSAISNVDEFSLLVEEDDRGDTGTLSRKVCFYF